jgi:hypothetical protein
MATSGFGGRRSELEEKFFHDRDKELLQALRDKSASKERKKALAETLGITNEDLLNQLDELDIASETVVALSLIPLISVAWADGKIDSRERKALIMAAEQMGMDADNPGRELLDRWLRRKPDSSLLEVWKDYTTALLQTLGEPARDALKNDILGRARQMAETTGGLLGLGNKVSGSERAVLDKLEKALA